MVLWAWVSVVSAWSIAGSKGDLRSAVVPLLLQRLDGCSSDSDCEPGFYCFSCMEGFRSSHCVRSTVTNQFKLVRCGFDINAVFDCLTTILFYIFRFCSEQLSALQQVRLPDHPQRVRDRGEPSRTGVPRVTFTNQEDSVTQQLNEPAVETFREIEAFLAANPSEIITLILEDYVRAPNGLTRAFNDSGLLKYWFPAARMPRRGGDWPLVSDMIAANQRLESEGIAFQWNYMVENQYGDGGMKDGRCRNRVESAPLDDKTKSLVLVNYFSSIPLKQITCVHNSADLMGMLHTCYAAAGSRWANFVAVDYYKRSKGGGPFQATDTLNGRLLCGCDDVHAFAKHGDVDRGTIDTQLPTPLDTFE
ncbi:unnamed protein product [Spirodela intermedia]|uniref:Uncharacterized protein n=1 Tax=Spirodela intermedia TaxID=51605 RepID=A0A7I8IK45_SPIIN|nr:unnamed protein product [Spirodela intermedia]CAA6657347.1 unnamed protein product [Spirodela intermedia]